MFYFRHRILNTLRDEVLLTMASAKMTLFHLLCLGIPAGGLAIGIAVGVRTQSVWRGFLVASACVAVGTCLGWVLPRSIWAMLCFFGRRGWFLQPQSVSPGTILSREEFLVLCESLKRDATRQSVWWIGALIALVVGGLFLLNYVERAFGKDSNMAGVAGITVVVLFVTLFVWIVRGHRRLVKRHGLACPVCDRELSDVAGGAIVVSLGFCRQCGAKVIDVEEVPQLPSELDMY